MSPRAEVRCDGTIGREEALGVSWRFEPLPAPFPLAGGLVRILRAIIKIAILAMFYSGKNLSLGGPVALQFIGDDDPRYGGLPPAATLLLPQQA
jgi:hypothetical protein